jgi:glycosyltransferase involved in cell wall biosynthesis
MSSIAIVVPAFNEAKTLRPFFDALAAVVAPLPDQFELLVVDDGSSDRTWEEIQRLASPHLAVRAIRFSRNFGKEAAIAAGLESAHADAVMVMDADLQHPPGLVPEIVEQWHRGAAIVQAIKTNRGPENLVYSAFSRLFYGVLRRLDVTSAENATDFCLLDAEVLQEWRRFRETGLFFRGMSAWLGFATARVPFEVPPRSDGRSRWTGLRLFRYALRSLTAFTSAPLHLVTVLGLVVLLCAVVLGTRALILKISGEVPIDGVTTIILLILFIGSCLMLGLGVIGEYVARIYDEVKGRPRYIVQDRYDAAVGPANTRQGSAARDMRPKS